MYRYMNLFESRYCVSALELMGLMEISRSTFKRDLAFLRDRFDVPIIYDRDMGGYKLAKDLDRKQIPGIWFNSRELQILKMLEKQLLELTPNHPCKEIAQLRVKLERAFHLTTNI